MHNLGGMACLTFLLLGPVAGCGPRPSTRIVLDDDVARPDRSVVLFFVDGLDRGRFEAMCARGELPNLERRFVRGGVGVEHAIVSIPSVTYANAVSLITGRFPGHHGVLGNRWFDRRTLTSRDYGTAATYRGVNEDFACPTVYEILADHFTVNVQNHTRRGVSVTLDQWAASGFEWFVGTYSDVDARVGRRIEQVAREANRAGRWPSVLMNYFPGVDEVGHRFGPDSQAYADALRTVDAAIGRIIDAIESARPANKTWYVLLTDHGLVSTRPERTFDLVRWLRKHGRLRVHDGPVDARRAARYDAVVINGADRRCAIHLRGASGWAEPARSFDRLDALTALPGVGLVCWVDRQEQAGTRSLATGCATRSCQLERPHSHCVMQERRSAYAPVGVSECSQGWSAAEPLVADEPDDPRPGRGGGMLNTHGEAWRSSAPTGAVQNVAPPTRGFASLRPWLHSCAPFGAKTTIARIAVQALATHPLREPLTRGERVPLDTVRTHSRSVRQEPRIESRVCVHWRRCRAASQGEAIRVEARMGSRPFLHGESPAPVGRVLPAKTTEDRVSFHNTSATAGKTRPTNARTVVPPARIRRVRVASRNGRVIVERRGEETGARYRMIVPVGGQGSDPLGYRDDLELAAFVDAGWHSSREWLAATAHARYPDFVVQVVEMFDSPRAGDIVVFAADDWAFSDRYAGGHGSCLADDMRVPLFFAGPGLTPGTRIDHARLVDVMLTVLDLLGEHGRLGGIEPIDGVSLVEGLRNASVR